MLPTAKCRLGETRSQELYLNFLPVEGDQAPGPSSAASQLHQQGAVSNAAVTGMDSAIRQGSELKMTA